MNLKLPREETLDLAHEDNFKFTANFDIKGHTSYYKGAKYFISNITKYGIVLLAVVPLKDEEMILDVTTHLRYRAEIGMIQSFHHNLSELLQIPWSEDDLKFLIKNWPT